MNKLTTKLILSFIFTVLISLALAMFITFQIIPKHIKGEIKLGADEVATLVEEKQLTESDLEKQISNFSFLNLEYLTKEQLAQSPLYSKQAKNELLNGHVISSENNEPYFYFVYPLQIEGKTKHLQLMLDQSMYKKVLNRAFILLSCITLFIGILLNGLISYQLVRPIRRLTALTKQFALGNFKFPKYKEQTAEIDQLYKSFSTMSNDLDKTLQSQKDFISNISHEFQTPLTSINGFAKALQQKEMSREKQNHYLEIIDKESARLSLLSRNVLKLSNLQNNTQLLEKKQFNLAEQIRQVIISLETQWDAKQLTMDIYVNKHVIVADEMLLYQVWYNLINNAINFSPIGATIQVKMQIDSDSYQIIIKDEGPGIEPNELDRVKEPFYKAKNLKSTGNGLGLSIVENIIRKHEGTVILQNDTVGLSITVKLPLI